MKTSSVDAIRVYLKSVVFLLVLTGMAKAAMAFGEAHLLYTPSPLFKFLSNRLLLLLAASAEMAVATLVLTVLHQKQGLALTAVAGLATLFIGYRLALWGTGFQGYCNCLGSLPSLIHLSEKEANQIALGIVFYLFVGSYGVLVWLRKRQRVLPKEYASELTDILTCNSEREK